MIRNYLEKYFIGELTQDIKSLRTKVFLFVFNLLPDFYTLRFLKNILLKLGGAKLSVAACYIRSPFYCNDLSHLYLGKNVFINKLVNVDGSGPVFIGDNVNIGPMVCIENVNHLKNGQLEKLPVQIGNNVWIGAGCILVPNSSVREGIVVAAGSIIKGNLLETDSLYAGVPAVFKKLLK